MNLEMNYRPFVRCRVNSRFWKMQFCGFARSGRETLGPSLPEGCYPERAFYCPDCSLNGGLTSIPLRRRPSDDHACRMLSAMSARSVSVCATSRHSENIRLNRADSTDNASARSDNQRLAVETGQLGCSLNPNCVPSSRTSSRGKAGRRRNAARPAIVCGCDAVNGVSRSLDSENIQEPNPSFWDCLATVNHAGVTARGFRLVKVEPRDSKKLRTRPKETTIQASEIPKGSLCATD